MFVIDEQVDDNVFVITEHTRRTVLVMTAVASAVQPQSLPRRSGPRRTVQLTVHGLRLLHRATC
jgi:hypothetical protein